MNQYKHYIEIHLAVLLFGGAGLFGKLIHLSSGSIVLGRAFLGAVFIFLFSLLSKVVQSKIDYFQSTPLDATVETSALNNKASILQQFKPNSLTDLRSFALLGGILAFHWVAFFQAIQSANVTIGVLTFSTFPIFTILMAPWFTKEAFIPKDLLLAFIAFLGVALIMPSFSINNEDSQGALWGIASGLSFALLTLISKSMIKGYSSNCVSFYQNGVAALILLPFFSHDILSGTTTDWFYLVILGVIFTGIAHTLFINSMHQLKAQTASLIANLEPVYGIFLAWFFLGEVLTPNIITGGSIILLVAFYAMKNK